MLLKIIILVVFAAIIVSVGIIGARRAKSFNDFFLGGGTVGPWMTAFTYGAAYFSAVLFIGFAGKVGWSFGYSGLWIAVCNALVGVLAVWLLMGERIKNMAVEMNVQTMGEYLERRYNSPALKLFAAISIFVFFIPYTAAVFMGLSYLFQSTFHLSYTVALIFMGIFTAFYLSLGGYKSMTLIDVIFGVIMLAGVGVMIFFGLQRGGGFAAITASLKAIDPKLVQPVGPPGWWPLFSLVFLTSVAPFAMPQLVQKFYAIKDKRSIQVGAVVCTVFALVVSCVAYFIGTTTRIFLTPESAPNAFAQGKPIFDALMPELLTKIIPDLFVMIILLLIFAASMSTLAALVLISSSAVAKDFYSGFINPSVSDMSLTRLMRVLNTIFVLLAVILAYTRISTIVAILGISWGAIGSVFLGPFVWGLFWKGSNKAGAWGAAVIALGLCLGLYVAGKPSTEAGTVGMIASFVLAPVISWATKKES